MSHERDHAKNATSLYEIRLKGHVSREWTDWFDGLTITLEANGETLLSGPIRDQAALHGYLRRIRDLAIPLLSVTYIETPSTDKEEYLQKP